MGLGVQLVLVPAYVLWRYWDGVRVFVQRDDGGSNLPAWACRVIGRVGILRAMMSRVRMWFQKRKERLARRKTGTMEAQVVEGWELGNVGGVLETGLQNAAKPNASHTDNV